MRAKLESQLSGSEEFLRIMVVNGVLMERNLYLLGFALAPLLVLVQKPNALNQPLAAVPFGRIVIRYSPGAE